MTYNIISTRKARKPITIKEPGDIVGFLKRYTKSKQEAFLVITLSGAHEVIAVHIVTIGLVNKTIIHPREIFIRVIKDNAFSIIIVHNHPSGNCKPSAEDDEITKNIKEAGELLGINLLDHLIITKNEFYSFRKSGKLK